MSTNSGFITVRGCATIRVIIGPFLWGCCLELFIKDLPLTIMFLSLLMHCVNVYLLLSSIFL